MSRLKKNAVSMVAGAWVTTLLGVAVLAGCGGSESDAGAVTQPDGTAQTQASGGTVSGMSDTWVLLNDIKYNKTSAQVLDDDDQPVSASALKLGMQVDVLAAKVDPELGAASAKNIAFGASVEGVVDSVNEAAGQLVVFGQTFQVSDGTVFADELSDTGLAGVAAGNFAKVQGVLDAKTGITSASRVEVKKSVRQLRLRGVTSELDNNAKTVKIGGQLVNFANAKAAGLADGQVVRSLLQTEKVNGQFVAKQIGADRRFVADGAAVSVSAKADEVTSSTSFKLLGLAVDATQATITNGAALKVGATVAVKGALSGGKLVATSVNVKASSKSSAVELQGALAALNASKQTFALQDVAVSFNDKTKFVGGSAADLAQGVNVNAKGKLASNGTQLKADTIEIVKAE